MLSRFGLAQKFCEEQKCFFYVEHKCPAYNTSVDCPPRWICPIYAFIDFEREYYRGKL